MVDSGHNVCKQPADAARPDYSIGLIRRRKCGGTQAVGRRRQAAAGTGLADGAAVGLDLGYGGVAETLELVGRCRGRLLHWARDPDIYAVVVARFGGE